MLIDKYNELINRLKEFKDFDSSVFNVRLVSKSEVPKEIIHQNLNQISVEMPDLIVSDFREKENEIIFKNEEKKIEKQKLFKIADNKEFVLAWGLQSKFEFENEINKFFFILNKYFQIYPLNVAYIEIKLLVLLSFEVDHYELFKNVYYNKSLEGLFEKNCIISNDISILGSLGNNLRSNIIIESTQNSEEILEKKYENKNISFRGGVALMKILPSVDSFSTVTLPVFDEGIKFLEETFIPIVINPIFNLIKNNLKK